MFSTVAYTLTAPTVAFAVTFAMPVSALTSIFTLAAGSAVHTIGLVVSPMPVNVAFNSTNSVCLSSVVS